jgi:hypothetical protein
MAERYIYIFIFLIQLYHTKAEKYRKVERYQRVNQESSFQPHDQMGSRYCNVDHKQ